MLSVSSCIYDSLSIFDGDTVTSPVLLVSCGNEYLPDGVTTQVIKLNLLNDFEANYFLIFY